ncbi:MAG: thiamine-phosphate kinase [Deltaproteobacteria bacterium]|nr:thiamine-phosphate kinase [Deltaproteobacteria bacterium]
MTSPPEQAASLSEEEIIRLVASLTQDASPELAVGIGDDAAVMLLGGERVVVTTDLLVEGVHFDLTYFSAQDLGYKAMAANLSDLAAMGAVPRWGFLSMGLPPRPQREFVEGLLRGLSEAGAAQGLSLAGGDTVRSPKLVLNLCLMGLTGKAKPLLRRGARVGDAVCVTGTLGGSAAGLTWLQQGGDPADPGVAAACQAHLRPQARVAAGRALAETGKVHAMMDLSDGLASDLARLCRASQVGAIVNEPLLPLAPAAVEAAGRLEKSALDWALRGGEDFELMFACEPGEVQLMAEMVADAEGGLATVRVGTITKGPGVFLKRADGSQEEITLQGFDHFREEET